MKRSSLTVAARLDRREQLVRRGLGPALPRGELRARALVAGLKSEDVGRRLDQSVVVESLDMLLAEPLDVEGVARHEMLQALDPLRRADQSAGAAPDGILLAGIRVDLARGVAAAGWADIGKSESLRALRPLFWNPSENLRDDVAGALHDHGIADADILARDLVLVMQRCVLDHDAADGDGIELGDGRERAGAPDLDVDAAQDCGRLLRRKFVSERPSRRARAKAEAFLEIEAVDLVDDAVDVVAERGAVLFDLTIGFQHFVDAARKPHQRIDREAPTAQRLVEAPLRIGRQALGVAPAIGEEAQRPLGGNRWSRAA